MKGRIHKQNQHLRYKQLMRRFADLFYYGCDVDLWLPEVMLYPYVTMTWQDIPIWCRIIAPPGCGKSAHISLLDKYPMSYVLDALTPHSLISGFRGPGGNDYSKLPQLNNKVLVISDESTLMEQRQDERNAIQAMLRKAYDGRVSKAMGNVLDVIQHEAYFNMLTAATPQFDRYFTYNQALGERFLNFRLQIPNRRALTLRAYENQRKGLKKQHNFLREHVEKFVDRLPIPNLKDIKITPAVRDLFIDCADFIARLRTRVPRDATGTHITNLSQPEIAGRLIQQMVEVAAASTVIQGRNRVGQEHIARAVYIGLCSMPAVIAYVLYYIWRQSKTTQRFTIQAIALETKLGRATVSRALEDLSLHNVLDLHRSSGYLGRTLEYSLSRRSQKIIKTTRLFEYYMPPKVTDIRKRIKRKVRRRK